MASSLDSQRLLRDSAGTYLSEFPPALFIFVFLILFPLLDLLGVGTGMATLMWTTNEAASRAATQQTYDASRMAIVQQSNQALESGFAHFAKLKPIDGYLGSGYDLFIHATNFRNNEVKVFGPNTPLPPPVDTSQFVYEYSVKSTYDVGPFIPLTYLPLLGDIPGLGRPARMTFVSSRAVEHPEGLDNGAGLNSKNGNGGSNTGNAGGTVTPFNRQLTDSYTGDQSGLNGSGWNYPDMYRRIRDAGQTVVLTQIFLVPGSSDWVNSGVTVQPGEKVWIDSKAVGRWSVGGGPSTDIQTDASGTNADQGQGADPSYNMSYLIGMVGSNLPTNPLVHNWDTYGVFPVGDYLLNYPITTTGPISFRINDDVVSDNSGQQMVRLIVTR